MNIYIYTDRHIRMYKIMSHTDFGHTDIKKLVVYLKFNLNCVSYILLRNPNMSESKIRKC